MQQYHYNDKDGVPRRRSSAPHAVAIKPKLALSALGHTRFHTVLGSPSRPAAAFIVVQKQDAIERARARKNEDSSCVVPPALRRAGALFVRLLCEVVSS